MQQQKNKQTNKTTHTNKRNHIHTNKQNHTHKQTKPHTHTHKQTNKQNHTHKRTNKTTHTHKQTKPYLAICSWSSGPWNKFFSADCSSIARCNRSSTAGSGSTYRNLRMVRTSVVPHWVWRISCTAPTRSNERLCDASAPPATPHTTTFEKLPMLNINTQHTQV